MSRQLHDAASVLQRLSDAPPLISGATSAQRPYVNPALPYRTAHVRCYWAMEGMSLEETLEAYGHGLRMGASHIRNICCSAWLGAGARV